MKYYYNPLMKKQDEMWFIDIYREKKGRGFLAGTVSSCDRIGLLESVNRIMPLLNSGEIGPENIQAPVKL